MDNDSKIRLQQQISQIKLTWFDELHKVSATVLQTRKWDKDTKLYTTLDKPIKKKMPELFRPWLSELSPSALYNCSLKCRKAMGYAAPEVKWINIKRWVTTTPSGFVLPEGVYYSIKRHEVFDAMSTPPRFVKTEFILLLFPYGNMWSQVLAGKPITEDWLFNEVDGKLILEHLMDKDAAHPVIDYFEKVYEYYVNNEDQIGIHLKRKKKSAE